MAYLPGEQQLLEYIATLEMEGLDYQKSRVAKIREAIEFIRGKQYRTKPPKHKSDSIYNFIHQTVERKVALLTDTKPIIRVRAMSEEHTPVAEILTKCCEAIWHSQMMDLFLQELVYYDAICGAAFSDTAIDPELSEPVLSVIDPRLAIYDPLVTRPQFVDGGEYFITWSPIVTEEARDLYPKRADDIQADYTGPTTGLSPTGASPKESIIQRIREIIRPSGHEPKSPRLYVPRSWMKQVWFRDRRRREGERVYPYGRYVKIVGGVIVEDMPNPYYDGRFPHDMISWYMDLDSAWGMSEYELLKSPQESLNKMIASVIDNVLAINNQVWIGDYNALTEKQWQALGNVPGAKVKKRPGTDLRRDAPPSLPSHVFQFLLFGVQAFDQLSGLTEVMTGRKPGQVTSGAGIEALQLAAQTVIRLKARQLEAFLQRIGQKLVSRIFQSYTTDRVIEIVGPEGKPETYTVKRAELIKGHSDIRRAHRHYQFIVEPGSSLAMARWQKMLLAAQLFQLGVIDDEELLEAADYPNRREILERVREKRATGRLGPGGGPSRLPRAALKSPYSQQGALQEPVQG
jgi:hypothetical protein